MWEQVMVHDLVALLPALRDAHIYLNHVDQVREQLIREPYPLPTLWMNKEIKNITEFNMYDFRLDNYQSHSSISAPMAV